MTDRKPTKSCDIYRVTQFLMLLYQIDLITVKLFKQPILICIWFNTSNQYLIKCHENLKSNIIILLSNIVGWIKMLWCILKADNMINYWTTWLFQSKRNSSAYSSKNDKMYCGLKSVVYNGISKLLLLERYFIYGSNIGSETWSHFSLP